MRSAMNIQRPKNLDLRTIRLPINAVVSILHRMSGVVLFLLLPLVLWVLQTSLCDEVQYALLAGYFNTHGFKLLLLVFMTPLIHHLYAGLRHLGQDVHWMTTLQKARFSGKVVLCLDAVSLLLLAWAIW